MQLSRRDEATKKAALDAFDAAEKDEFLRLEAHRTPNPNPDLDPNPDCQPLITLQEEAAMEKEESEQEESEQAESLEIRANKNIRQQFMFIEDFDKAREIQKKIRAAFIKAGVTPHKESCGAGLPEHIGVDISEDDVLERGPRSSSFWSRPPSGPRRGLPRARSRSRNWWAAGTGAA